MSESLCFIKVYLRALRAFAGYFVFSLLVFHKLVAPDGLPTVTMNPLCVTVIGHEYRHVKSPSLMYVLNRKGSATEPCQTPDFKWQEKGRDPRIRTAVCSSTAAALKCNTRSQERDSVLYQKGVACMPYVVTYSAAETAVSAHCHYDITALSACMLQILSLAGHLAVTE
jgi:hypothetical protein